MISLKQLKEIIILSESGINDETIANIFKINPKGIKKLVKKGKKILPIMKMPIVAMDEEQGGGGSPGTAAPAQPTSNKWAGASHGRANPTDQNHKWESGINRGKANQLN